MWLPWTQMKKVQTGPSPILSRGHETTCGGRESFSLDWDVATNCHTSRLFCHLPGKPGFSPKGHIHLPYEMVCKLSNASAFWGIYLLSCDDPM